MTENVKVHKNDMVTLVKIVNDNTNSLDKRVDSLFRQTNAAFNMVDSRIETLEKRAKLTGKTLGKVGIALLMVDVAFFLNNYRLKRLEKEVKELKDEKIVNEFMGDNDIK